MLIQEDSRWGFMEIAPEMRVADAGCLFLCLCNANALLGNHLDPREFLLELKKAGGFTKEGILLWAKLKSTKSLIWMQMKEDPFVPNLRLVEYSTKNGTHFVLYNGDEGIDPKPGTIRTGKISERRFSYIPRG